MFRILFLNNVSILQSAVVGSAARACRLPAPRVSGRTQACSIFPSFFYSLNDTFADLCKWQSVTCVYRTRTFRRLPLPSRHQSAYSCPSLLAGK